MNDFEPSLIVVTKSFNAVLSRVQPWKEKIQIDKNKKVTTSEKQ